MKWQRPGMELIRKAGNSNDINSIVNNDKKTIVKKLRTLAKKAETVWLASDEDREGEAIAWHLKEQLGLKDEKTKRIVFHEITKNAILKAVENPRDIDYNMVNAQQARRVLDRLVGYELSPVLWRKVKGGKLRLKFLDLLLQTASIFTDFKSAYFWLARQAFPPSNPSID